MYSSELTLCLFATSATQQYVDWLSAQIEKEQKTNQKCRIYTICFSTPNFVENEKLFS